MIFEIGVLFSVIGVIGFAITSTGHNYIPSWNRPATAHIASLFAAMAFVGAAMLSYYLYTTG